MFGLSIIIVNHNSWFVLEKCLQSIENQKKDNTEVIIIDNNSTENLFNIFKKKYNKFIWINRKKNLGFSKACNLGAEIANYNYFLFLNPDTELENNCLSRLTKKVVKFPSSILSISQENSKGKRKFPYGNFLNIKSFNGAIRFLFRLLSFENRKNNHKKPFLSPDWVSGSFFLIDKKNFYKLNGWDEDYWMYFEDMDLCKRAKNMGIRVILINSISCIHHHGKSSRVNLKTTVKTKLQLIKSGCIFINKHYNGAYKKVLKSLFLGSIILELIIFYPFSKEKRMVLGNLIFNFRVKNF